jgi:hypothetical protein
MGKGKPWWNMTSTGSPNSPEDALRDIVITWRLLIIGAIAIILALVIGTQVIGVLYSILFPMGPPLPTDTKLLSHKNIDYGVDEWVYGTDEDACKIVAFYQNAGGQCRISPTWCGESQTDASSGVPTIGENVARCQGQSTFSIFALSWDAIIGTGYPSDGKTQFRLRREVFWTGQVPKQPPPTPPEATDTP